MFDLNVSSACPDNAEETRYAESYWAAKDELGILNDLGETTGVSADQLVWDDNEAFCTISATDNILTNCNGSRNIGKPSLPDGFTVSNPKDIISARLQNVTTFQSQSDDLVSLTANDWYIGNTIDILDGAAMLVLMLSSSITSMKSVEKIRSEYHKAEIEEAILLFVTALLLIIPGLGEIADDAGMVAVAITLRAIGVAGDAGSGVYGIVSAKGGGPGESFLALPGGLGALEMLEAHANFAKVAKARRAMSAEHIATLESRSRVEWPRLVN
ncbi:hypothetical protein N7490_007248 [Penicillium lividum]|nr:hypothetical protein N7490_007248 [Penicillium lividum]